MMSFKLWKQAFSDLYVRYAAVFKHAWKERKKTDTPIRLKHEMQFLPAELALQETPVSPAPRAAMWILIAFAGCVLLWATFGYMDVVATASGKIIPSDRIKTIQTFETASVKKIYVTDGQAVKAGDVLIELDATATNADANRIDSDLDAARLQVWRAKSILTALQSHMLPKLEKPEGISNERFQEALSLLKSQYGEYSVKVSRMEAEIARREAELSSAQEMVRKFEKTVPIAQQRAEDFRRLVEQNFVSKHGYMEREQTKIEQEADLAAYRSRVREIEAALREAKDQRAAFSAEFKRINLDSLNEGMQKTEVLAQEMVKAVSRDKLMTITAPVDGTVQQLAVHTVGGVVTPAQPVMIIVPKDHHLEIEAFIENKDIGFVKPNQDAEVKVETFQYTKYGTIPATVASVSHDAIQDEKRGLIYSARIRIQRKSMMVDGVSIRLSPGMATTVDIKIGKRRVIEYFLDPLLKYTSESLRER